MSRKPLSAKSSMRKVNTEKIAILKEDFFSLTVSTLEPSFLITLALELHFNRYKPFKRTITERMMREEPDNNLAALSGI